MKFDVHHAGAIGGTPIGVFITTIEATDHSEAKRSAERRIRGRVVVLPHRPTNEKLERAIRKLDQRPSSPRRQRHGR